MGANIDNVETLPMDLGGEERDALSSKRKLEEDKDKEKENHEKHETKEHEHEEQEHEVQEKKKRQEKEEHQLENKDGKEQPLPETKQDQEMKDAVAPLETGETGKSQGPRKTVKQWMTSTEIMAKLASFSKPGPEKRVCHPSRVSFGWRADAEVSKLVRRPKVAVRNSRPNKVEAANVPIETPKNWGKSSYISADQQCPPKKRGRKRKAEGAEEGQVGKKKAKTEKTKKTRETGKNGRSKTKTEEKADDSKSRPKSNTRARPAKAKAKASTKAKPKAKAKGEKAVKTRTEVSSMAGEAGSQDAAEAERLEKKKKLSRKSAAYHKALKQAKAEGKSEEQCKAAGKKVSNLLKFSSSLMMSAISIPIVFSYFGVGGEPGKNMRHMQRLHEGP